MEQDSSEFTLEQVALDDDSDDDFEYEEVEVEDDGGDEDDVAADDLETALRSLHGLGTTKAGAKKGDGGLSGEPREGGVARKPEVLDDFFRNFLVKMKLQKTLEMFESEWYELSSTGKLPSDVGVAPDIYVQNQEQAAEIKELRSELENARTVAQKATATWDKFRKERDFHRMHHKRVTQEKNKLVEDIKRLKKHYAQYEPTVVELKAKYEAAMKERMLMRLERDRLQAKVAALEATLQQAEASYGLEGGASQQATTKPDAGGATAKPKAGAATTAAKGTVKKAEGGGSEAALPGAVVYRNPYLEMEIPPAAVSGMGLKKTFKGHVMSVSNLAMHPSKPIVATASDDRTWKMWSLPNGDLIMSGDGHKDWVAGISFHPLGSHLASASGDGTVKLWDFEQARCTMTFAEHTQAVWDVDFHHTGDFVLSCSLDHSARLWDVHSRKCRQAFRGHVDSVNSVAWQPFSSSLATGSSDKTVSLWDARTGLCTQTFYGHLNSCNCVTFNLQGDLVASTDADGLVKLWDVRTVTERGTINVGPHPANKCCFDASGQVLAVAGDDGSIKCFNVKDMSLAKEFNGHEDAVQAVVFDAASKFLTSLEDALTIFWGIAGDLQA
eukprot:jgi/Mesvir1/17126/Mv07558-RA.1